MNRFRLFAAAAALTLTACTENLDNAVGCPILCPNSSVDIQTTTVDAVVLDTTVSALEAPGSTPLMLLATRGDTLDTRIVMRFDSIIARYRPVANDTTTQPIETIPDAFLRVRIETTGAMIPDQTTIRVYNVETTTASPDTAFGAVLPFFTPDRLIGETTLPRDSIAGRDSLTIPINGAALLSILQTRGRLRIGLQVSGSGSAQFYVFATESGLPAVLSFRPAEDTTVARQVYNPFSLSPEQPPELRENLGDYVVFAQVPPLGAITDLNVGGLPARRSYLRFSIPPFILDSTTVVRATLLLTQRPNRVFPLSDTMGVAVHVVLAGAAITDIARAATLTGDPEITQIDTLFTPPADSGEKAIDIAPFLRFWRALPQAETPHAIVLASTRENGSGLETRFFSIEAAPELRPRLRISYSPRQPPGLP